METTSRGASSPHMRALAGRLAALWPEPAGPESESRCGRRGSFQGSALDSVQDYALDYAYESDTAGRKAHWHDKV